MLSLLLIGIAPSLAVVETARAAFLAPEAAPVLASAPAIPVAAPVSRSTGGLVLIGPPVTAKGNEVYRSRDGLFYVTAIVNGAAVRFVVDTGATVVVLTAADARRAGIALDHGDFSDSADTANGKTAMARVKLDKVTVGSTQAEAIEAAVVNRDMPVSLLGQSWLSRLESITIAKDRLTFN